MNVTRIVIIGGGFGGVKCAKTLRRRLRAQGHEIVLFSLENHMVFSPLLADAVGSSLNPFDVVVPLRQMLPGVLCRSEEVRHVDVDRSEVEYEGHDGQLRRVAYDHLVIACGNISRLDAVPGMADHAFPLKTIGDAGVLRSHVLEQMEKAEVCDDPARKRWYLSFIVVGGGYSGVETAGEINDLVRDSLRYFHNIRPEDIAVTLVHSRDQILSEIGPNLREFARVKMQQAGVKILLNTHVVLATPEGIGLKGGDFIKGATAVCTIGSTMAPVVAGLSAAKEGGRLVTEPDMRLRGIHNAWAIGDCAYIVNAYDNQPASPTGQLAEREGRQVADNIARALRGEATQPFYFKPLGQLCSIGGRTAVAELFGAKLSGFLAWFVWRGVYWLKVPSWSHRFKVGFDWAWLLLFPRDLSHVKVNLTDRVSRAHYQPGDFVYREGDSATSFYVIEKGEAEVLRRTADNCGEEILGMVGPGSFFGEQALIGNRPRAASVRARSPLDILVLGRDVFTHMSGSLAPLRNALAQTLISRAPNYWEEHPKTYEILRCTQLAALVEPAPQPILKPTATIRDVSKAFVESGSEFLYVSSDGTSLEGIVTLTDVMRAWAVKEAQGTVVSGFMTATPIAVTLEDTCVVAEAILRDRQLKWIPVVRDKQSRHIAGCIRVRTTMARLLKEFVRGDSLTGG